MTITNITSDPATCDGGNDGKIYVTITGGTADFTYELYKGIPIPANLIETQTLSVRNITFQTNIDSGKYTIQVFDSQASPDFDAQQTTVSDPDPLNASVTVTHESCAASNDGELNITNLTGGSGSFEFSINGGAWSSSTTYINRPPGDYDVDMRDANATSCTLVLGTFTINAATALAGVTFTLTKTDVTCSDLTDGTINVSPDIAGSYEYSSNGTAGSPGTDWQAGETFNGKDQGTYHIWVRKTACAEQRYLGSVTITKPTQVTAAVQIDQGLTCYDGSDGILRAVPGGGTPGYNYQWYSDPNLFDGLPGNILPGETNITLQNIGRDYYTVVITDNNGCTGQKTYIFDKNDPFEVFFNGNTAASDSIPSAIIIDSKNSTVTCPGGSTGTISITASGGTGSLEYGLTGPENRAYQAPPGDFINLQGGTYTILVRDANSCVNNSETIEVIEDDSVDPVITTCPLNRNINANAGTCQGTIPDMTGEVVATDNCNIASVTQSPLAGSTFGSSHGDTQVVIMTVTDDSGNSTTCNVTLTLVDNQNPTITTCPIDRDINTNVGVCQGTIPNMTGDVVASDNCNIASITQLPLAGSTFGSSHGDTQIVTMTVTDDNGNTATCNVTLTLIDNEDPAITTCPPNRDINVDPGTCQGTIPDMTGEVVATDNCNIASITQLPLAGANFGSSHGDTQIVTMTVTDDNGNTATCNVTLTLVDAENPTITTCPLNRDINVNPGTCQGTVPDMTLEVAASDNCNIASVTQLPLAGTNFGSSHGDTQLVTMTVTDDNGNTATCNVTLTLIDNESPVITTCPPDRNINTNPGVCEGTIPDLTGEIVASDNCSGITVTQSPLSGTTFGGAHGNTQVVTMRVDDANGNFATCNVTLTLNDNINPVITCPGNQSFNTAPGTCNYTVSDNSLNPTVIDNCTYTITNDFTNTNTLNGASFPVGFTNVNWTVTDAGGNTDNCSFIVAVSDIEDPTISCPGNASKNTDASNCFYTVSGTEFNPTATNDNCGVDRIENNINGTNTLAGEELPVGVNNIIWTVYDVNGRTNTCSFNVTVNDNQTPVITTCPSDRDINANPGVCQGTVPDMTGEVVATDNCSGLTITQSPVAGTNFGSSHGDTQTVTMRVEDGDGNFTTCSVTLTLVDNQNPVITTCPVDRDINVDPGTCQGTVPNMIGEVVATDNCNIASTTQSPVAGSNFGSAHGDTQIVTITVTDDNGNIATCNVTLTLVDDINPVITTCPPNRDISVDPGTCQGTVPNITGEVVATDNCNIASITQSPVAGSNFGSSHGDTQIVTMTVTDDNGNTATCNVTLTLIDDEDPVITTCPPNRNISVDPGTCQGIVPDMTGEVVATDNCTGITVTQSPVAGATFGSSNGDTQIVTMRVEDANGNFTNCSVTLTLVDDEDPVITTCPADRDVNANPGACQGTIPDMTGEVVATDNCTGITVTQSPVAGATFGSSNGDIQIVTMRVEDANGNFTNCSVTLTLVDNQNPVITTCPADRDINANPGVCQGTVPDMTGEVVATDNCSAITITQSPVAGANFGSAHGDTQIVTMRAEDANGNFTTCSVTLTLVDNQNPTISCIPDPTKDADPGQCFYTVIGNEFDPASTNDNCVVASVTNDYNGGATLNGETFPVGVTTVIWTVFDQAGNNSSCSIDILVNPSMFANITPDPVQICAGVDLILTGNITGGTGGFTHAWTEGTAGTLTGATDQSTATFNYSTAGTYRIYYTATDINGCTAIDSIDVEVYPGVSVNPSPVPANVCPGDTILLSGNPSGGDGNYIHNWNGPVGTLINPVNTDQVYFSSTTSGLATVNYTVTDGNGCIANGNIDVNVYPAVTANITPDPAEACINTDYILDGNPGGGSGSFNTHLWSGNAATYLNPNNSDLTTFNGDTPGIFQIIYFVEDDNGCSATDTSSITVFNAPEAIAGNDITICYEDLSVQISNADTNYTASLSWSILTGSGSILAGTENTINPIYEIDQADRNSGLVELILTANGYGSCLADRDTIQIIIPEKLLVRPLKPSPFTITANTTINVTFEISEHTFAEDLSFYLVAPDGTEILLKDSILPPSAPAPPYSVPINVGFSNKSILPFNYTQKSDGNIFSIVNPADWTQLYNNPAVQAADIWSTKIVDGFSTGLGMDGIIDNITIELRDTNALGEPVSLIYESIAISDTIFDIPGKAVEMINSPTLGFTVSCFGECDAEVSLNITGGAGTDSIVWRTLPDLNPVPAWNNLTDAFLCAGDYNVKVYDLAGCVDSVTFNVATPNEIILDSINYSDTLSCAGDSAFVYIEASQVGFSGLTFTIDSDTVRHPVGDTAYFEVLGGQALITIYGKNDCNIDTLINIYEPLPLDFELISTTDILCYHDSTGSIEIRAEGGSSPYEFILLKDAVEYDTLTSSDTVTFINLPADSSYVVQINDNKGCFIYSDTVILTEPVPFFIDTVYITPIICNNESATIEIIASGGTPGYEYSIMGDTLANYMPDSLFTGLTEGDYYVYVKDVNGCTTQYSDTINIVNPAPIVLDSTQLFDVATCPGDNSGEIIVYASGGLGGLEYSINGGSTYQDTAYFVNLSAGDYEIAVMDSLLGCEVLLDTVTLFEPDSLILDSYFNNITCNGYADGTITAVMTGGTQPYTYELHDGFGGVLDTQTVNDTVTFTNLVQGNYLIYAYDANKCDTAVNLETISEPGILTYNVTYSDIVCYGDSGDLVIDVTGGTSPFFYTINNGTQINFVDSSLLKMAPGVDTISVYDFNNCKASLDTIITFTNPPEITLDSVYASEILCAGGTADTLYFSGSADTLTLEYSINGTDYFSEGLFTNIPAGPITLYIQDLERGCVMMFDSSIYEPTPLVFDSILITNPTSDTSKNGILDIYVSGGTGSYFYSIDSAATFDVASTYGSLETGTYNIFVRDANNCEIDTVIALDYNIVNITYTFDRPSCNGYDDGYITVEALNGTAPFTYTLFDLSNNILEQTPPLSQTTYSFDSLVAGNYQFQVQDDAGRLSSKLLIPLDDFDPVEFGSISITPIACNGYNIDTIILTGSGGTGIYEYAVDTLPFQNSGQFTDIEGGLVSLYVRDNNGCTYSVDTLITEPTPLVFDSVVTTITSGIGINDGTMTIYASGGTPPYEYALNSGTFQPAPQFINLAEGFYDLTLRDAYGCTLDTIIEIAALKVTITSTEPLCYGTNTGTITISISEEGEPSFLYSIVGLPDDIIFSDSTTYVGDEYEHTFTKVRSGNHSIYIQDGAGRVFETTYFLDQPEPLSLDIITGYADCQIPIDGTDVGTITIEVDGGTPEYVFNSVQDFNWLDDSIVQVENLLAGDYTVNILDANGCSIVGLATVDPDPANIITINPTISPADLPACYGTTIDMSVSPVNANTVNWTDIYDGGILSEGEFLTYDIERTRTIRYSAENTVTGCMLDYLFYIPMYPRLNLSLISDTILLKETSTYIIPEMDTSMLDSTYFTWISHTLPSDIDYLNESNVAYPIFTAPEDVDSISYELYTITNHNCVERDTIGIRIINVLKFPSGFTPNGDGINDKWIPNQALLGRSKVEIFNRWGKQVFYSDGYSDPWDGTYNGKELPMGTYYYIVTIKVGKEETITGTVTIMR